MLAPAVFVALAAPSAAQCGEDGLEDNDTCAAAVRVAAPFARAGLVTYRTDPDYFATAVPPGDEVTIDARFVHAEGDIDVYVFNRNDPCDGIFGFLRRGISSDDDEFVKWRNTGPTPVEVAIRVEMFAGSIDPCNTYDVTIDLETPSNPCDPATLEDGLEDNDTCATAVPLPTGITPDLWVSRDDEDYFRATLVPGATLDAEVRFVDSVTDIDLFLYRAGGPCGDGFMSGELASGFSQTDNERIVWSNTSGVPIDVILHVDVWNADDCNQYDLEASISGAGIGSNYCTANPNSSGAIGLMRAWGSTSVTSNSVTLRAEDLPRGSAAFFLNSRNQGFVPLAGGSEGNLCLGGDVGRHDDDILNAGIEGTIELTIDLDALPQPTGFVRATAGQTWRFQAWYRDLVGGSVTSNLTNGIRITLTP
ncbi:MAG: hypothetical protein AAF726_07755 [Planctomycetota bacterium]